MCSRYQPGLWHPQPASTLPPVLLLCQHTRVTPSLPYTLKICIAHQFTLSSTHTHTLSCKKKDCKLETPHRPMDLWSQRGFKCLVLQPSCLLKPRLHYSHAQQQPVNCTGPQSIPHVVNISSSSISSRTLLLLTGRSSTGLPIPLPGDLPSCGFSVQPSSWRSTVLWVFSSTLI